MLLGIRGKWANHYSPPVERNVVSLAHAKIKGRRNVATADDDGKAVDTDEGVRSWLLFPPILQCVYCLGSMRARCPKIVTVGHGMELLSDQEKLCWFSPFCKTP